jgi:hypothetical protein
MDHVAVAAQQWFEIGWFSLCAARGERLAFHREVDLHVTMRGRQTDVTEPVLDHAQIDAGLQKVHRGAVAAMSLET